MKLSIITINYNDKEGLRKTIESVLSQTWTDYEYLIIDGGSADGSLDVIREYEDKITYWISEKDNGIYNAMNKGIVKSKGAYLQFLNSGDYLVDNKVFENMTERRKQNIRMNRELLLRPFSVRQSTTSRHFSTGNCLINMVCMTNN